jgi:hypothetical protein
VLVDRAIDQHGGAAQAAARRKHKARFIWLHENRRAGRGRA